MSKYPWARGLNIPMETISIWEMQAGQSDLLRWALANNKINEFSYQDWAKVYYQLPTLDAKFFDQSPKPELWERWGAHSWSGSFLPIYEWDGVLYIACLEPPNEKQKDLVANLDVKVGFLIAPISGMKKWWSILSPTIQYQNTNMHLPPELAAFSSGGSATITSPAQTQAHTHHQNVSRPEPVQAPVEQTPAAVNSSAPISQAVTEPVASTNAVNSVPVNPVTESTSVDPFAGFPQEAHEESVGTYQAPVAPVAPVKLAPPEVPSSNENLNASVAPQAPAAPNINELNPPKEEQVHSVPEKVQANSIPMSPPADLPPPIELADDDLDLEIDTGFNASISLEDMKIETEQSFTPPVDALSHTESSFDSEGIEADLSLEEQEDPESSFQQDMPTAPNIPQVALEEQAAPEPTAVVTPEPPSLQEELVVESLDSQSNKDNAENALELKEGREEAPFDPNSLLGEEEAVAEEINILDTASEDESIEGLEGLSFGDSSEEDSGGLEGLDLGLSSESAPEEMSMDTLSGIPTETANESNLEGLDLGISMEQQSEQQSNMPPSAHLVPDEDDDMLANVNDTKLANDVAPLKVAHPALTNTETPKAANHAKKEPQDKEEEMAYRALNQFADYFEKGMVLQVHQMMLKPYVWNDAWTQNQNMNANVDLSMGSIFRIVFTSRKPYHGYVVRNPINDSFFNAFNKGQLPEHATIVPVSLDGNLVAMVLGFTSQQNADSLRLEECERIADNYAKDIKDFYKSQLSAA